MNKVYDNGAILLGNKKNVVNQIYNYMLEEEFDDFYMEILKDLEEFADETIVAISYDSGMSYNIDYWNEDNEVGESYEKIY